MHLARSNTVNGSSALVQVAAALTAIRNAAQKSPAATKVGHPTITSDAIVPCWRRCTRRSSTFHRFDA